MEIKLSGNYRKEFEYQKISFNLKELNVQLKILLQWLKIRLQGTCKLMLNQPFPTFHL